MNKIDLWEDEEERKSWAERQMRTRLQFVPWAVICFISALEGRGTEKLLELAATVRKARRLRIPTAELNTLLSRAAREHVPPLVQNRRFKLFYTTQAGVDPPTFILFVNDPSLVHFSYKRFLERRLREAYDFEGTAIKMVYKARAEDDSRP